MAQEKKSGNLLETAINDVLKETKQTYMSFVFTIRSLKEASFKWTPFYMDDMKIIQGYENNYGDIIEVSCTAALSEIIKLYKHVSDMEAHLRLIIVDESGLSKALSKPPDTRIYKAHLLDQENLNRQIKGVSDNIDTMQKIRFRLTEKKVAEARRASIHGVFSETTVESVMKYMASSYGFSKIQMTPSENTHEYSRICVPKNISFENIWVWMQERYGVYKEGIATYIYNDTMYIYPPYSLNPKDRKGSITFYLDSDSKHASIPSLHRKKEDKIDIVLQDVEMDDKTSDNKENNATGYMWSRASTAMDSNMQTTEDGSFFTHEGSMIIASEDGIGKNKKQNIKFLPDATDNVFKLFSNINKDKSEIVSGIWNYAILNILFPGQKIKFFYQEEKEIKTTLGILSGVKYDIERAGMIGNGLSSYTCTSDIVIRIRPEE